jgi:inorganic triphosphatase YgiF
VQRTDVRAETVSSTQSASPAGEAMPEFALTLTGKPASLAAAFKSLPGGRARVSHFDERYFDTDDGRLRRKGYSLRLRQEGERFEMTLARRDGATWTTALPDGVADLARLPADAPRGEIGVILPEELRPSFTGRIDRRRKRLALDGASIAVTLDTGCLAAAAREAPVAALEFGLLIGSPAVLYRQLRALLGRYRLTMGGRDRAVRGLELLNDAPPAPVKAERPALDPTDSVEAAMAKILTVTTAQILGNLEAAADGRDPEGVHQLRVALRRLRSAFALFRDHLSPDVAALNAAAKQALNGLGAARDLDVFLLETAPPLLADDGDNPGLQRLIATAEARRREAYDDVRRMVQDRDTNRLLIDLLLAAREGGLVVAGGSDPLGPIAAALLHKRHRKALKIGRHFARLSQPERHEVRIALKKLRYACDYFQTLFPGKPTRAYLKRLAGLQDDLGRLNDATVAEELVDRLAGEDTAAMTGAALVKGWYRHRLMSVEPHMLEGWQRFTEARPFWQGGTEQGIK